MEPRDVSKGPIKAGGSFTSIRPAGRIIRLSSKYLKECLQELFEDKHSIEKVEFMRQAKAVAEKVKINAIDSRDNTSRSTSRKE